MPAWRVSGLHAELMAEREHLGAELRVGAGADENQIGEEADELVREAEKHGDRSCPMARRSAAETASSAQERYAGRA